MQSSRYGQGSANPGPVRRPVLGITAALAGAGVLALGIASGTIPVLAQDAGSDSRNAVRPRAAELRRHHRQGEAVGGQHLGCCRRRRKVASKGGNKLPEGFPDVPEDSPFYEFFKNLPKEFKNMPQRQQPTQAQGSGFVISADGYVVTNNHVIDGATKIQVSFDDQEKLDAELVGTDPRTDVALLKIKPSARHKSVPLREVRRQARPRR